MYSTGVRIRVVDLGEYGFKMTNESFIYTRVHKNMMDKKISNMEFQDLKEYAESLEKRISRLERVLCKMIEADVNRMAKEYEEKMKDYEGEWK